ncbi:hypothetical protein PVNG_05980 [Plasmodium vivax North Korean]|uniref:PIR Superfamily Protein n=1 Tax=Plasmodium vivax North Korean TaxID=1035514 RepID=A0A0J9TMQ8_PLAVI|nr:hypothetical protein PVNG_05980 [Plasmodium vivax North Korean]
MDCTEKLINYDTYDFFDKAINYIESSNKLESNTTELDAQDNCTTFSNAYTSSNFDTGKKVCELFLKLYNSLSNVENNIHDDYKKEWHFLNYWLNINISKRKLNKTTCATKLFEGLSNHCMHTLRFVSPPSFSIYNIREEDLKKMNLLYGLYENYRKLNDILSGSQHDKAGLLLGPSAKCCSDYAEANYLCNDENNKFCAQLKKFKTKYDGLYNTQIAINPEYTNNFKKLSECNNNTVSTAVIGTTVGLVPLLVGLYKVK